MNLLIHRAREREIHTCIIILKGAEKFSAQRISGKNDNQTKRYVFANREMREGATSWSGNPTYSSTHTHTQYKIYVV